MNALESAPEAGIPAPEPYPGYNAEVAARQERETLAARAGAAVLPGALRGAFATDPPQIHGYTLQPVTMGLHPILERINSPLLEVIRILREEMTRADGLDESTDELKSVAIIARQKRAGERAVKEINSDQESNVETVFCFITPAPELRRLLADGRASFREAAMIRLGDKIHPAQFNDLQKMVSSHYIRSFATAVQHRAKDHGKEGAGFTPPPARTASAGGSPSSAH
jgi:hypothetical protein